MRFCIMLLIKHKIILACFKSKKLKIKKYLKNMLPGTVSLCRNLHRIEKKVLIETTLLGRNNTRVEI